MDIKTMRKIVDGAPGDATDIDHTGAYWKDDLIMVDGKYREDTRGWALIKWRLSYLRTAIADHNRTDYVTDIRNHISPMTIVLEK